MHFIAGLLKERCRVLADVRSCGFGDIVWLSAANGAVIAEAA
jgi:hypothetical protein